MIEHFFDDMWRDTDTGHAGCSGAAQIVKPPIAEPNFAIEAFFQATKARHWCRAGRCEQIRAFLKAGNAGKNAKRLITEMDYMLLPVLGA